MVRKRKEYKVKNEIKVMVRYPEEDRTSIGNLESMRIRNNNGDEIPFHLSQQQALEKRILVLSGKWNSRSYCLC